MPPKKPKITRLPRPTGKFLQRIKRRDTTSQRKAAKKMLADIKKERKAKAETKGKFEKQLEHFHELKRLFELDLTLLRDEITALEKLMEKTPKLKQMPVKKKLVEKQSRLAVIEQQAHINDNFISSIERILKTDPVKKRMSVIKGGKEEE